MMIHSFLLIGQSNAAGRGFLADAGPLDNLGGRLKVLRNGLWVSMYRPVNPDRHFSGTCFAESFAKEYALAHNDISVGIIPCADGGTQLAQWLPGEILFDNAVNCAKLAMRSSRLKGILWHQGEGDCREERCAVYSERFSFMINALRKELDCPDIPVLVGGLGDYLANYNSSPYIPTYYSKINEILEDIGKSTSNCAFVSAVGLGANPDNLHFSAPALDEFGIRYYKAYEALKHIDDNEITPRETTDRTALELL